MLKMRSECVKTFVIVFCSYINCTRQEGNGVRETVREISKILQNLEGHRAEDHAAEKPTSGLPATEAPYNFF